MTRAREVAYACPVPVADRCHIHPAAVRKQIQSGTPAAIYLLQGEDDVEKSALAAEFAELVEEGLRAFNVERIHAGDMTTGDRLADGVASIVAAARTLPMMSPRRVVMVLQAETLLAPKRESDAASRALERVRGAAQDSPSRRRRSSSSPATIDKRSADVQAAARSTRRSSSAE